METNLPQITIPVDDISEAAEFFTSRLGFRVEMVVPADSPETIVLSGHGARVSLQAKYNADSPVTSQNWRRQSAPLVSLADDARWVVGRAGMEYRALAPGRLGGRLAASLIKLTAGGTVNDYVHYHRVSFQMIYCVHGKVRVVYEDQGEPFWLLPSDCVLQPPGIRHRVLESSAGAQVIELTSPAVHETWADQAMELPTQTLDPSRKFDGQTFVHRKASGSTPVFGEFGGFESHHVGIHTASNGAAYVYELRTQKDHSTASIDGRAGMSTFYFVLSGRVNISLTNGSRYSLTPGDAIILPPETVHTLDAGANSGTLCVVV